jgi:CRISPR-associated endonuclease Csn1
LYKAIKKDIADIKEPEVEEILNKIGNEKFLLKLNSTENAQVPYQLNLAELESIIDNQGQYYPILKMNKDKIISILKFRIPYYVGPLNRNNDNKRIFAWMERKSKDKIYPWNFEEVVDLEKSAENFILKMTNQCSYFPDCDVLPNNSLLYSEYKVLNELNKVRIDGKLLSTQVKLMMLCDLLRKEKNVTEKMIVKFLKNKGVIEKSDNPLIQGMQGEKRLANNLKSHIFFESLGFDVDGKDRETVENIIRWVTLFTDKKILKKKIRDTYNSELISNEVLKKILKRDFKGWGSLSEKLIDGVTTTNKKFENGTILDILKISNMNFMQIISDENLGFNKIIEEKNSRVIEKITIEDIESLHGSPSIKRGIWQSVRMVEEIISIMKNQPRNIFIKVNKEEGPKRRTIPRINRVDNLYEEIKKSRILNIDEQIQEVIDKTKKDKGNIDDNKLYLYLLQNGKCMFTGENLVLEDLSKYRISYIIPKSIIEDNSISNKVLVKYAGNHRGPNGIIIKEDIRNNMKPLWDKMLRVKLISFKKYKNLTAYKFSKEHIENLMNKELVETRQITKHVANLFRNCYIDTDVVTVKATLVERLRRKYELFKVQNLNDFHYAHDSYLTGLLGTFLMKRFPTFRERFYFDVYDNFNFRESGAEYGFIIEEFGKDIKNHNLELVWNSKKIIEKMSKSLDYYDCFISYKKEEKVGGFYNQNPSAKSSGNLMPLKKGLDTELYGGFGQISKSYLLAVEGKRKNKVISTLANCPVVLRNRTMEEKIEYISRDKGLENLKILNDKIMLNQLILKDGMYQLLKSDIEIINAVQIVLPKGQKRVLYNIERKMYKNISSDEVTILFDVLMEKIERFYPVYNKIRGKLLENRGVFIDLSIIEKCQIILEILKLLQANSTRANFKILGLSSDVGRQTKIGIKLSELIFVERSVTGLYEKKWKVV